MNKLIILIILLHALITKIQAQDAVSNVKSFLEKSPILEPFNIIKKTAEKISSVGLEKIFFGLAVVFNFISPNPYYLPIKRNFKFLID